VPYLPISDLFSEDNQEITQDYENTEKEKRLSHKLVKEIYALTA